MDISSITIGLILGIAIGAFAVWLILSRRLTEFKGTHSSEHHSLLLLNERVQTRDSEIQRLQTAVNNKDNDLEQVKERLTACLTQLAAANERNLRLQDLQTMLEQKNAQIQEGKDQIVVLERSLASMDTLLQEERKNAAEKLTMLNEAKVKFEEIFKSLSDSALNKNTESFMHIAKSIFDKYQESAKTDLEHRQKSIDQLVKPLSESLKEVDQKMTEMEKIRSAANALLTDQVSRLADTQNKLQQALRAPATRGRWGEVQLRRVVEMAGMVEHCDFLEQETVESDDKRLRPDMVILLPEGKRVVVDSKVPLQAYLDSLEAQDDVGKRHFQEEHVRQLRAHIQKLAQKCYWEQFSQSPEFVVLFLPNDAFFIAATEQDPTIVEDSIKNRVLIATPMTLVALLQTVAYSWRQQSVAENAEQIKDLGKQLYDRVRVLAGHFEDIRKGLQNSVNAYNKAASTLERRVLVTTRKFKELGAADGADIEVIEVSESAPVHLRGLISAVKPSDEPAPIIDASESSFPVSG